MNRVVVPSPNSFRSAVDTDGAHTFAPCQTQINGAVKPKQQRRCVRTTMINLFASNGLFVTCIVFGICNRSFYCCAQYLFGNIVMVVVVVAVVVDVSGEFYI